MKEDTPYVIGLILATILIAGGGVAVYNITSGLRRNNPGNIRYNGTGWVGLADPPFDGGFCVFISPEYGIRALALTLQNYVGVDGIPPTVTAIISRYAPPSENDTAAYILDVCGQLGLVPGTPENPDSDVVDFSTQLPALIAAIISHENGFQPYSGSTISQGIALAMAA